MSARVSLLLEWNYMTYLDTEHMQILPSLSCTGNTIFQLYFKRSIFSPNTGVQLSAALESMKGLIPSSGRRKDRSLQSSLALRDCIASRTDRWHCPTHHFPDGKEINDSASVCFPPPAADQCIPLCAGLQHSHHAHKPCCLPKPSALALCIPEGTVISGINSRHRLNYLAFQSSSLQSHLQKSNNVVFP